MQAGENVTHALKFRADLVCDGQLEWGRFRREDVLQVRLLRADGLRKLELLQLRAHGRGVRSESISGCAQISARRRRLRMEK